MINFNRSLFDPFPTPRAKLKKSGGWRRIDLAHRHFNRYFYIFALITILLLLLSLFFNFFSVYVLLNL